MTVSHSSPEFRSRIVVEVEAIPVQVPSLLADCFAYIFSDGLVEGIFRVSGSARRMRLVSSDYGLYRDWLNGPEKKPNPHDVAGAIKKFLREYLDSIDGLFSSSCLSQVQQLYLAHVRSYSDASIASYRSANTSLGSANTLPSVVEDDESEPQINDPETLLDSVAHLLITKNLSSNNEFFIYMLLQLKQLSLHEDKTKMTVPNLSIIFQPYIFNTRSLSELKPFQNLLTFLVLHYDDFVQKFLCYKTILGGLEELDADNVSVISSESYATSPLTLYSSHHGSPAKNTGSSDTRRKSISQRFSIFWDSYNLPANRSKRFSLGFGSKSSEKIPLPESAPKERRPTAVCPHQILKSSESLSNESSTEVNSKQTQDASSRHESGSRHESVPEILVPVEINSAVPQRPLLTKRASSSKRKSFIGLFKSSLSVSSIPSPVQQESPSPGQDSMSPLTPPTTDLTLPSKGFHASVDDLLLPRDATPLANVEQKTPKRSFSLRLKRK